MKLFKKKSFVEQEIESVEHELTLMTDPTSDRYKSMLETLKELRDLEPEKEKFKIDKWIPVIAALTSGMMSLIAVSRITEFEKENVLTTKAKDFIKKF